ncbi:MAG: sulfotransferase family protein [Microcoleaceae cyanobacterium]
MKKLKSNKVFAIGFQKTGTTSLGKALDILGYQVCGYWEFRKYAELQNLTLDMIRQKAFELTESYDAFKDTPWPIFYQELDRKYPNSKFILVIRDTDSWINSVVNDFCSWDNSIHKLIYGVGHPKVNESVWIERYERHNKEAIDYFKDRPNDFLLLNLKTVKLSGWEKICTFLGEEKPEIEWPHTNKKWQKKNMLFIQKILNKIKS